MKGLEIKNHLANILSAYRIISSPVLIVCLLTGHMELFKWLLAISFFTDAADGYLARWLRTETAFGARLDSIGDDITVAVAIFAVARLYPSFFYEQAVAVAFVLVLLGLQIGIALLKFRKMTAYHTYLAKLAAVLQAAWLLCFLFLEMPLYPLFYLCIVVTCVQIIEEILITLVLSVYTVDVRGIFWALKKGQSVQ